MVERKPKNDAKSAGWTTRLSRLAGADHGDDDAFAEPAPWAAEDGDDARGSPLRKSSAVSVRAPQPRPSAPPDPRDERAPASSTLQSRGGASTRVFRVAPSFEAVAEFVRESDDARMTRAELAAWLARHAPLDASALGEAAARRVVQEPGVGAASLVSHTRPEAVAAIVALARERVIDAARGLFATPARDSFLVAALVRGAVRRDSARGTYVASPRPTDALSDVILATLAVDVLAHRDDYDAHLRVCDVCGSLSLDGTTSDRRLCAAHTLR